MPIFTTWGPVRQCCDHAHKTLQAAKRCLDADTRRCASPRLRSNGVQAFSDRGIRVLENLEHLRDYGTAHGPGRPLTEAEHAALYGEEFRQDWGNGGEVTGSTPDGI